MRTDTDTLSPVDAVDALLERICRRDPELRATYADEARLAAEGIPRRSQRSRIKRTQPTNLARLLPEAYPGMVRGGPAIFDTSLAPRLGTAAIRVDNLPLAVMSLPAPSWRRKSRASSVR